MSAKFSIVTKKNPQEPAALSKYYPQVKSRGRVTTRQLAQRIAEISTVSSVDTLAVLEALLVVVPQELGNGHIVQLGELGSFSLRTRSSGSDTPEAVTARNITNILPAFRPGKLFRQALAQITFEKE